MLDNEALTANRTLKVNTKYFQQLVDRAIFELPLHLHVPIATDKDAKLRPRALHLRERLCVVARHTRERCNSTCSDLKNSIMFIIFQLIAFYLQLNRDKFPPNFAGAY